LDKHDVCLLQIAALRTGYGARNVIPSLDLCLYPGEFIALLGHNGAGKSTLLKAIAGVIPTRAGRIIWETSDIALLPVKERIELGIAYVPQGQSVFPKLTVRENLRLRGTHLTSSKTLRLRIDEVCATFKVLKEREHQTAGTLSGGEKQVLALAGALIAQPRMLLLDEPSAGLSPFLVPALMKVLDQLSRDRGVLILMAEQRVSEVLGVVSRALVLNQGSLLLDQSLTGSEGSRARVRESLA